MKRGKYILILRAIGFSNAFSFVVNGITLISAISNERSVYDGIYLDYAIRSVSVFALLSALFVFLIVVSRENRDK